MAPKAKGFALWSGDLSKAKICLMLEMPGGEEPSYLVKDLPDGAGELERRAARYPDLDPRFIRLGAPVVGRAGIFLWTSLMGVMGIHRNDVAVFNTLHCFCGKNPDGSFFFPKGDERKKAEGVCAELWLQPLVDWDPTVSVVSMHPSALVRDVTPLPIVLRSIERAKEFVAAGERVLLLMGGKPAKMWLGFGENTTRWCCHYQYENELTRRLRRERWERGRALTVTKEKKVKKLNAKSALLTLLSIFEQNDIGLWHPQRGFFLSNEIYTELMALTKSNTRLKPKKELTNVA